MPKLTSKAVEVMKPAQVRQEIPDALLPGLYLIVQPSGAKSWAVRYRHHGRTRKHTLGRHPALDLQTARELARKALRIAAENRDPGAEKRAQRQRADAKNSRLVDGLFKDFLDGHVKKNKKGEPIRESTRRETARLLGYKRNPEKPDEWTRTGGGVLAHWRGRQVTEITADDVMKVLKKFGPVAANRTLSALKTCFSWRVKADSKTLPKSPCEGIDKPSPETDRDRVLSDDELRIVWHAAEKVGPPFGSMVQLLILLGQRRGEIAQAQWSEIDIESRLWALPRERVKNNKRHEVPLSDQAIAVIRQVPRVSDRFVFSTNGSVAASNFGKNKRRLDALLPEEMQNWTLHDVRRSVASGMASLGVELPVIERVLNHVSGSFGGIVGVYQKHEFSKKRDALDRWGRHIEQLVTGKFAKIVAFG
jgi:integrase